MNSPYTAWYSLAGHGAAVQAVLIVLGTFVLEDAATVLAAMDAQVGRVSAAVGLGSLYAGVVLGDLGLYGLGYLAARVGGARRGGHPERAGGGSGWLRANVVKTVFVSRFLPGARLPTYTACGFVGVSLGRFALAAVGATLVWTSLLFGVSLRIGRLLIEHLGAWRWVGMAGFALTVVLIGRLAVRLRRAAA